MTPTMVAGLRAMAAADESPHEAAIARQKLADAGIPVDPPRPPAPPAAPAPMPNQPVSVNVTFTSGTPVSGVNIYIRWGTW